MKSQEQRAYEAWYEDMNEPIDPSWEQLPARIQEAWRAAIRAAVDSPRPPETLTDVQVRLLEEMGTAEIGRKLKAMMRPGDAFILFTVPYGTGGNLSYVATMDRDDARRVVREWLRRTGG